MLSPDGVGDADGVPSLVDASSDADSFVGGESSSSGSSSALAAASRHAEPILASSQVLSLDGVEACWAVADALASSQALSLDGLEACWVVADAAAAIE